MRPSIFTVQNEAGETLPATPRNSGEASACAKMLSRMFPGQDFYVVENGRRLWGYDTGLPLHFHLTPLPVKDAGGE